MNKTYFFFPLLRDVSVKNLKEENLFKSFEFFTAYNYYKGKRTSHGQKLQKRIILSDLKMVPEHLKTWLGHKIEEEVSSKSRYLTLNVLEMYVLYSCVIHQGQLKVVTVFCTEE